MTKFMNLFDPFPSLIPYTIFDAMQKLFDDLDYHPENQGWSLTKGFPKGDVVVENDKGVIELALAGYTKDQLSVQVEGNKLIISAKKAEEAQPGNRTLARRSFRNEFYLGKEFDLENTEVTYKDGLLRVVVPKAKPQPKVGKTLEIK